MVNISTLGQYMDQVTRLKGQQQTLGDLTVQISTGKKTQKLSGLGNDIIRSARSWAGINELETYNGNIQNADRRIKLMLNAVQEMKAQANNIAGALTGAIQQGEYPDLAGTKQITESVYGFMIDLMNQTDGERYLFGGADTAEPPITDSGLFTSALGEFVPDKEDLTNPPLVASGMVGAWGDGSVTTEQFIASYKGTPDAVLGFSNALTSGTAGATRVRVNDTSEFDYTQLANKGPMKDIVRILGVIKALPPVESAPGALNDPTATTLAEDVAPFPPKEKQENFYKVLTDLRNDLNKAIDQLDTMVFNLSQVQAQVTIVKNSNADQINAYKDIIGDVEDADITEVSVKIKQMEVQMQASFQVTALLSQLTLANYLGR